MRGTYKTKPEPGSWAALIAAFRQSPRYRNWAPATKKHADRVMDDFRIANGRVQVSTLDLPTIILLRDGFSETPAAANNWLKILGHLLRYAKRTGFIDVNPLADGLEKLPPNRPGGFRTWREDEIEAFRAHWPVGSTARLAFELALNTGAAPVDLVKLGWSAVNYDKLGKLSRIRYRRQKTERRKGAEETPLVDIPILPELAEELSHHGNVLGHRGHRSNTAAVASVGGSLAFLPRSPVGLGNSMRRWTAAAGLGAPDAKGRHLTLHGLRKALGRRLAEAGASPHVIMAMLGHETISAAQVYTSAYDRARAADMGAELLSSPRDVTNVTRIRRTKE
jgi:integrase